MSDDKVDQKIKELAEAACDEEEKLDFAAMVNRLEDVVYTSMGEAEVR